MCVCVCVCVCVCIGDFCGVKLVKLKLVVKNQKHVTFRVEKRGVQERKKDTGSCRHAV